MEIPGLSLAPIIFIVLVIVPGVFAKRFYFLGEFSKQFGAGLFADRIITSMFWGFFIQVITFELFAYVMDFTLSDVAVSIIKAYKEVSDNKLPSNLEKYDLKLILGYISASVVLSALLGMTAHTIVRTLQLDTKFRVFRYANHWHYYFSGEILKSPAFKGKRRKVISTSADVVMDGGDQKPKMFSGLLSQYTLSARTGEIETIILTEVRKYSDEVSGFVKVPSDFMVIPYNKVIDLNIRYESREEDGEVNSPATKKLITIFVVLSFSLILIVPWFFGQSFFRTLFAIMALLMSWLSGSLMLLYVSDSYYREKSKPFDWKGYTYILLIGIVVSALLLNIDTQIVSFFSRLFGN